MNNIYDSTLQALKLMDVCYERLTNEYRYYISFVMDRQRYKIVFLGKHAMRVTVSLVSFTKEDSPEHEDIWLDLMDFAVANADETDSRDAFIVPRSKGLFVVTIIALCGSKDPVGYVKEQLNYLSCLISNLENRLLNYPLLQKNMGRYIYVGCVPPLERIAKMGRWTDVRKFSEGLVAVADENGRYGFLDSDTEVAIECRWANVQPFSWGMAAVEDEHGRYGFIDREGQLVIPYRWKCATRFSYGLAAVMGDNGKWGFIYEDGSVAVPCTWDKVKDFNQGWANVYDSEGLSHVVDFEGQMISD